jgi:hypothetical protein
MKFLVNLDQTLKSATSMIPEWDGKSIQFSRPIVRAINQISADVDQIRKKVSKKIFPFPFYSFSRLKNCITLLHKQNKQTLKWVYGQWTVQ